MRFFLFTAFLLAVITLTTGASVRNYQKLNEKHSVKQHASRRVGNRLRNEEAKNILPDVDSDEDFFESDLEDYEDDEWPDFDLDTVAHGELDLDEVADRRKSKRKARKAYRKGRRAARRRARKARKAAKKAKKASKKARSAARRKARKNSGGTRKAAKKTYKKAKKAAKKAYKGAKKAMKNRKRQARQRRRRRRRRRRQIRRRPRYTPRTRPPRYTRPTGSPPKKNPPKKYPPKKYPPKKYPTRYPPTRPPSKGSKFCRCRIVAKPAKECYSFTYAEKGYCRLRKCEAKWECLTSGRSRHICMRKFATEKIVPVRSRGKYTRCRTMRHPPKPFYVLYRTTKSYPRPKPYPRPTRPGPYTRGTKPRHRPRKYPRKYRKPKTGRRRTRRRRRVTKRRAKVYPSKSTRGRPTQKK